MPGRYFHVTLKKLWYKIYYFTSNINFRFHTKNFTSCLESTANFTKLNIFENAGFINHTYKFIYSVLSCLENTVNITKLNIFLNRCFLNHIYINLCMISFYSVKICVKGTFFILKKMFTNKTAIYVFTFIISEE